MAYSVDFRYPAIYGPGANVRTLTVHTGATSVASSAIDGTLTLLDSTGATVASGTITDAVATITIPSGTTKGGGYTEQWAVSSSAGVGNVARIWTRQALVMDWQFADDETISGWGDLIAAYPQLASLLPSGWSDWDRSCTVATSYILHILARHTRLSTDAALVSRDSLHTASHHCTLAVIYRLLSASTGGNRRDTADWHEARYRDEMARLRLPIDTDGDGGADAVTGSASSGMASAPPVGGL